MSASLLRSGKCPPIRLPSGRPAAGLGCVSCWGATLGGVSAPARSALGITAGGRLVWAGGEHLTPSALAAALLGAGVVRAVELDINPEWVAGTFAEADWEASMLNGNSSVFFDYYNRAEWFMENGGPDNDPNFQMGVLNFIKDENGNPQKMTVSMKYLDECVTAVNAKCSEEKIKTILTFIDYFYTEEGIELANYGVEGESFEVAEDGTKQFIVDYQTEEATPVGEKRWSFLSDRFTVCKPVDRVTPKFCVKSNECRNRAKFICRRQRLDRLPPMSTT